MLTARPGRLLSAYWTAAFVISTFAAPVMAQNVRDEEKYLQQCNNDDPAIGIPGCTAMIAIAVKKKDRDQQIQALQVRSHLRSTKNDHQGAVDDLDEALRLGTKDKQVLSEIYNDRGTALIDLRRFDEAIADLDRAFSLDRTHYRAPLNKGLVYRERGDYDQAISVYTSIIESGDRYANYQKTAARSARGEAYRLKGDMNAALRDLDRAVQDPKAGSLTYVSRGIIHRYVGDLYGAFADFDRALRVKGVVNEALIYTERGLTFEKQRNFERAKDDYQRALSYPPYRSDTTMAAQETARARIAALASGLPQPVIPAVPAVRPSPTSIPTPPVVVPAQLPVKAPAGRRIALVIGNSAYKSVPELPNPKRDAEVVAATLRNIGFDNVTVTTDVSKEKLTATLRAFADEAEKADWAMVYYAGHGIEMYGSNHLIPIDAKLATDRDVQYEAVPLEQVLLAVEGAKRLRLVVLDACRDNPFAPQMRQTPNSEVIAQRGTTIPSAGTRSVGRGLGSVKVSGATLVVYAAKHGQTALDGEGVNSPFAVAMVQRLATPGVEINKVFRLVRDDVMESTAGRQEPYTYGSLPGREDFFFVEK